MQDQNTLKKDRKQTSSSQKKLYLTSGLVSAHMEKGNQGKTLSQVLQLQNGSPTCTSISPKRQAAVKYQDVISPKQLFKATISSEKQAINGQKSQPSFDAVAKSLQDPGTGERVTLGSTGPSVSIGNQPGGRSTATFESKANSNGRLTSTQTESLEQSLSARRFLKILPNSQSQQLRLMQPFQSNTVNQTGSVFCNEKNTSPLGKAKSPTNTKVVTGNKKPSHLNETISSSRRVGQAQQNELQIARVQSATPNGRTSTRVEGLEQNAVETMLKRAYKRQFCKSGSSIKPILADETPRIVGETTTDKKRPEGQIIKEKPQVDVEEGEDEATEEYMLMPSDRNETADVIDEGIPAKQAQTLLTKTKLAQAAHIQQQRLFAQHNENSSFGVQQLSSETPMGLVVDSSENPMEISDRKGAYCGQVINTEDQNNDQILFHRRNRRLSFDNEYESDQQEAGASSSTPSDYIEVDASEFPYADPTVVNEAIESLSENSYYEDDDSYDQEQDKGLDYPENQNRMKEAQFEFVDNLRQKKAIDESTPDKYATQMSHPVSDHKIIESSRSCKPVATGPLPSAFCITGEKPVNTSGCQTPFYKQGASPVHQYNHQTMISPKKRKGDHTGKKPKHFKLNQIPSLDLTHQALSPRKGSIQSVLQEQILAKGTPKNKVPGQYQNKLIQSNQVRNKAISYHNKPSKTPQGATFKNTYSNYLNEQTSVLAQKREQEREARERGLIQGADALRQKSTSATAKYDKGSRNPLAQTKKHKDIASFMSSKPSQKIMPSQAIFQTTGLKGNETPSILAGSPDNPKLDRLKTISGNQSGVKSKKKEKRKQSFTNNTMNLQAQVIQQTVESCTLQPFQKQKLDGNQRNKINKALVQEIKTVNSVRNHPTQINQNGIQQKTKQRQQAIDPSMTLPSGILGQQTIEQLDTAFQATSIDHRRGSTKVKPSQSKVVKVKKNSFNSNQLAMTGLAQKVNAVAPVNLKNDQVKPFEKQGNEIQKRDTGTAQKQRSKHFKTDAKGQDMSQQKVMRINSQAVQISKFGKQSSLACQVDGPILTEPSSTVASVTNSMTQNIELKSSVNQQFKQDKKVSNGTMNKNSVLTAKNQNILGKSNLLDQRPISKPGSVLAKSFKPVKQTHQRSAVSGIPERSSSIIKNPRISGKTEQTENSMIGVTTEKSKKPSLIAMNQNKLMTPRGNQSEVSGTNMRGQNEKKGRQDWGLLEAEKAQYGDRCPKNFEKLKLLGKGGCAIVWLAKDLSDGRNVALKQFPKPKTKGQQDGVALLDPTAKNEIEIGKRLFTQSKKFDGYSIDPDEFPGIRKIAKLYDVLEEPKDVWLVYEVGAKPLSDHLFEVKGEFFKGERIYGVKHQDFYRALRQDKRVIKEFIRMISQVFDVLAMFRIVHADIKPDNILIDFDGKQVKDVKLIDFGSAFSYETPSSISATTPEYLAPEVLEYLENRGANTSANGMNSTNLCKLQEPWSYDMWSLGAILLELLTGIPIWLSLKCRAQTQTGKSLIGMGIFGVQGRQGIKILQKQQQSLKNLQQTLKKYDCYGLDKDPNFMDLLCRMLDPNPITRISPVEVLEHPFIQEKE